MKQVFFGTPHKGANVATWGRQISNIAQAILHRPPANFLKILERHSPDLLKVSEDFRPYAMRYAITSFYEQHATKGLGSVVSFLLHSWRLSCLSVLVRGLLEFET
jgi:hypothetical protein